MSEPQERLLTGLAATLREMIAYAEAGDWERLTAMEPTLVEADRAIRESASRRPTPPGKAIQELIGLHQQLIGLCRQRMETIAPLIHSFDDTQKLRAKP